LLACLLACLPGAFATKLLPGSMVSQSLPKPPDDFRLATGHLDVQGLKQHRGRHSEHL
jgi:hypothetical protein